MTLTMKVVRLALVLALPVLPARADIPQLLNYQGYLTDDAGTPLNGVQKLAFAIFDAAEGGTQLWTEKQNVVVADGLFTVLLGTVTLIPTAVFDGDAQYLAVRVNEGAELTPRTRLVSVGSCFKAREAERLDGRASSAYARSVDGVPPQNGNVDLIAGSNVTITPNAAAGSVTIAASALSLPFSSSVSSTQTALTVQNTGGGYGASISSASSYGLVASSGTSYGVRATSSGSTGYGVYGVANGDNARGLVGSTTGANGYGVWGSSAKHHGVHGSSTTGVGVYGTQSTGNTVGLLASDDFGAYAENGDYGTLGYLASPEYAVFGERGEDPTSRGFLASSQAGAGGSSRDGIGVLGTSTNAEGVVGSSGANHGVHGVASASAFAGVYGSHDDGDGVRGYSQGGYGVHGSTDTAARAGVYGTGAGAGAGVIGRNDSGRGVEGQSQNGTAVYARGDLAVTGAFRGDLHSASGGDGAPFPRPAYDSGWRSIGQGDSLTLTHDVGGDPDDYVVDFSIRDPSGYGRHNRAVGGDTRSSTTTYGAYYYSLDDDSVILHRTLDDEWTELVRLRIWVVR